MKPINLEQPINCILHHEGEPTLRFIQIFNPRCSDRLIVSVGMTEQAALYIFNRTPSGWNIAEPEIKELKTIIPDDAKNFSGFSNMIYVKVRKLKNTN